MAFYLQNNTTSSRYIQIGDGKNQKNINIGPKGTFNDTIIIEDDSIADERVVRTLLASGVLTRKSAKEYEKQVNKINKKHGQKRDEETRAILEKIEKQTDVIVIKKCDTCGKEFGVGSSMADATETCTKCIEAKELAEAARIAREELEAAEAAKAEAEATVEAEETVEETPAEEAVEPVVTKAPKKKPAKKATKKTSTED